MFQIPDDPDPLYLVRTRMININKKKGNQKLQNRENSKLSARRSYLENSIWRRKLGRPSQNHDK